MMRPGPSRVDVQKRQDCDVILEWVEKRSGGIGRLYTVLIYYSTDAYSTRHMVQIKRFE